VIDQLEPFIDFSNFPPNHPRFSEARKAMFGYVKVDTGEQIIHAFLGERKKSYQLYQNVDKYSRVDLTMLKRKIVKKGCPSRAANQIENKDILGLIKSPGIIKANFNKLQSNKHMINMIKQTKSVSNSFDNSAFYKSCGICNIPFNCTMKDIKVCKSSDCQLSKLLVDIWFRVINEK
jgi:hypothetical protein